jgi:hypothetical protein
MILGSIGGVKKNADPHLSMISYRRLLIHPRAMPADLCPSGFIREGSGQRSSRWGEKLEALTEKTLGSKTNRRSETALKVISGTGGALWT